MIRAHLASYVPGRSSRSSERLARRSLIMNRLKDKVAVVTGGGQGIGRAISELFAEEAAAVVIAERHLDTGEAAAAAITHHGGKALFIQTEVTNEESIRSMVKRAVDAFGQINILVNNAGVFVLKGIDAT